VTSNLNVSVTSTNRRRFWFLGVALILAIPVAIIWWPNWRQYPAVTSQESLQTMKLLYTACNTKDVARLKQVEERVEKMTRAEKLSDAEQKAFAKILVLANSGAWDRAEKAAFRFAQDQVGVGHPAPSGHQHDHSASTNGHGH